MTTRDELLYCLQNASRTFQMDSNYGRSDFWRNTGKLKIMSPCCRKTGGSDVCWLGARDMGDLDEHLCLGICHYNIEGVLDTTLRANPVRYFLISTYGTMCSNPAGAASLDYKKIMFNLFNRHTF